MTDKPGGCLKHKLAAAVGAFVVNTGIGFGAGFLGTLIGTGGNVSAAFENGLIGFAVAGHLRSAPGPGCARGSLGSG